MQDVQAVVFDIGNVLIEWHPERFYDGAIGPERRKALFDSVDLHGMNDQVDRGGDFATLVADTAAANPDHADAIRLWQENWLDMASPAIDRSVRLLRALRAKGIPVFALSNFGIQTFEIAEAAYPFLGEFDRRYISGHMGVIKPDPAIYEGLERDSGLSGGALLFADDRADNVAMAAKRGWKTHLFTTPDTWADRLVVEALLTQEEAA